MGGTKAKELRCRGPGEGGLGEGNKLIRNFTAAKKRGTFAKLKTGACWPPRRTALGSQRRGRNTGPSMRSQWEKKERGKKTRKRRPGGNVVKRFCRENSKSKGKGCVSSERQARYGKKRSSSEKT